MLLAFRAAWRGGPVVGSVLVGNVLWECAAEGRVSIIQEEHETR
jgi:hypothetical protein